MRFFWIWFYLMLVHEHIIQLILYVIILGFAGWVEVWCRLEVCLPCRRNYKFCVEVIDRKGIETFLPQRESAVRTLADCPKEDMDMDNPNLLTNNQAWTLDLCTYGGVIIGHNLNNGREWRAGTYVHQIQHMQSKKEGTEYKRIFVNEEPYM